MKTVPKTETTTLGEDLRMVHPAAWVAIGLWLAAWPTIIVPLILLKAPNPAFVPLVVTVPALVIGLYIFMIFWVHADAARRRMNSLQWVFIAALVPYGIGFMIYLYSRQPVPQSCAACGSEIVTGHSFCHECGEPQVTVCPECRRRIEPLWRVCAHCGRKLQEQSLP